MFPPEGKTVVFFDLTPLVPLSPASGGISNMKWRGGGFATRFLANLKGLLKN